MLKTNALFKSSCDACIKTKSKCDGISPCSTCLMKGIENSCIFAFKRKRGPQSKPQQGNKKLKESLDAKTPKSHGFMSSYERRLWTVFFTIFKNQRSNHSKQKPYSWCWFARQLLKLYEHTVLIGDDKIMYRLECFFLSLDTTLKDLKDNLDKVCPLQAHMCSSCSVNAIKPGLGLSPPQPKPTARRPIMNKDEFRNLLTSNSKPCFVYDQEDGAGEILVNDKFRQLFGYTNETINSLIDWSGGGFLPWGGDVLAALFVHEADVLLYLQIMAFKYQASGLPTAKDAPKEGESCMCNKEWEIPSCHSFECWTLSADNTKKREVVVFFCTHRLIIRGEKICTRMELAVESVDALTNVIKPTGQDVVPVSHVTSVVYPTSSGGAKVPKYAPKRFCSWVANVEQQVFPDNRSRAVVEVDSLPHTLKNRMKRWSSYESLYVPDDIPLEPVNSQVTSVKRPLLKRSSSQRWIEGLLDWANEQNVQGNSN